MESVTSIFALSPTIPKNRAAGEEAQPAPGRAVAGGLAETADGEGAARRAGLDRARRARKNPPVSVPRRLDIGYSVEARPRCGPSTRPQVRHPFGPGLLLLLVCVPFLRPGRVWAQKGNEEVRDVSGEYRFLTANDTLGLLEEDGKIKGYIDVYQGEEESDTVLSYPITIGTRQKNHVEFKTGKIHQKYYRFSGTAERGKGHEQAAPDYLRLVGDLEIVTVRPDTGQESTERRRVTFQSKGKAEKEQQRGSG